MSDWDTPAMRAMRPKGGESSRNAEVPAPARSEADTDSTPDAAETEERFRRRQPKHPSRPCASCGREIAWMWSVCRHCGEPDMEWRITNDPRVDRSGECWVWTGSRTAAGYGRFNEWYVHRRAWEEANGEPADGYEIAHTCDNPPCCNPAHLFKATHRENMADAHAKGRLDTSGLINWVKSHV